MAKEYIERNALFQDIVATVVFSTKTGERNLEIEGAKKVIGRIHAMPTADVQEVIRCKDCRWRGTEECSMYYRCNCGEQHTWENNNDFCSYGERKCGDGNG